MSAAETLQSAADAMRGRAAGAIASPWHSTQHGEVLGTMSEATTDTERRHYGGALVGESMRKGTRIHVASWHPAVALAVADWLEAVVRRHDWRDHNTPDWVCLDLEEPMAVARAYLGITT